MCGHRPRWWGVRMPQRDRPGDGTADDGPGALFTRLVEHRGRGEVVDAMRCYETGATIVLRPGRVGSGPDAVRGVLEFFAASRATFTVLSRTLLEADGVALHLSHWSLQGVDPAGDELRLTGRSADVARRRPDGTWLVAVDDPWGTALLDGDHDAARVRTDRPDTAEEPS